jgi:hypothetical protein
MLDAGVNMTWHVTGTKCGTATEHDGPSAAAGGTYGGNAAIRRYDESITTTLIDCTSLAPVTSTAPATETDVLYLGATPESNYWKVGTTISTTNYGEIPTPSQAPIVYVGISGPLGTENWYSGTSNLDPVDGRTDFRFSVAADGSSNSSAIVDLISKRYDSTSALLYTEHRYYRISASGPLVPTKIEIQYATGPGSPDDLVFLP